MQTINCYDKNLGGHGGSAMLSNRKKNEPQWKQLDRDKESPFERGAGSKTFRTLGLPNVS